MIRTAVPAAAARAAAARVMIRVIRQEELDVSTSVVHDGHMGAHDNAERIHPETRAAWRDWLGAHHESSAGVWLVSWRKHTGNEGPSYEDAVEEALCFGWIDSRGRKLDDDRTMLWFSPRKPGSGWARPNKERVERLTAAGQMAPAGQRMIDSARADGSWSRLDAVEDLIVPPDLAAALDGRPPARENRDAFPRSVRRSILEWIVQAKPTPPGPPGSKRRLGSRIRTSARTSGAPPNEDDHGDTRRHGSGAGILDDRNHRPGRNRRGATTA